MTDGDSKAGRGRAMDRRSAVSLLAGALAAPLGGAFFQPLEGAPLPSGTLAGTRGSERVGGSGRTERIGAGERVGRLGRVEPVDRVERVGVQLYTVRDRLARDFSGTLGRVAEIGYREVEFAGYVGHGPGEVRDALDRAGLAAPAAHVGLDVVRAEWERTLEAAAVIGHRYVVVPSLPRHERRDLDDYRRLSDEFNRMGEAAREAGVRFAYHNHAFEFEPLDGEAPYDVLLERTDPDLVLLELDLYWIRTGGRDPLEYFDRYPGRFPLVHVKDMNESGAMVAVGEGSIDFRRIFARAETAGIRHFFVEHDNPEDPMSSIRTSYRHLEGLEF